MLATREYPNFKIPIYRSNDNAHYPIVNRIRSFIEENIDQKLTLDVLAREAGISKFYFQRLFKENFHKTPQQYIIEIRIQKAEELITGTDLPFTEIGLRCGFNDGSSFSRAFKKHIGMSPKNYNKDTIR